MCLLRVTEVELIDENEHFVELYAVLHVVVNVFKHRFDDTLSAWAVGRELEALQFGEQDVVDKADESIAFAHVDIASICIRPVAPTKCFGNDRFEVIVHQFPYAFCVVINFQEQHPRQLFNSLCITVDARILAHDVSHALNKISDAHSVSTVDINNRDSSGWYKAFSKSMIATR